MIEQCLARAFLHALIGSGWPEAFKLHNAEFLVGDGHGTRPPNLMRTDVRQFAQDRAVPRCNKRLAIVAVARQAGAHVRRRPKRAHQRARASTETTCADGPKRSLDVRRRLSIAIETPPSECPPRSSGISTHLARPRTHHVRSGQCLSRDMDVETRSY
jgi:hypothetical protein